MAIRTSRKGNLSVTFSTGSATPTTYTLSNYRGEVTIDDLVADGVDVANIEDRGEFVERVQTSDVYPTVSIRGVYQGETLTDASVAVLMDMLRKTGLVASDDTVDPGGVVWAIKVEIQIIHPTGGTDTITLPNARPKTSYATALDGNKLDLSFECARDGTGAGPVIIT